MRRTLAVIVGMLSMACGAVAPAATVLVEAESFADQGGWSFDTQFIREMGSPYLLAHGLGKPVADATTKVTFPAAGTYRVFVRTKDWVARWNAPGTPGRFQLLVNGTPLAETFGTKGAEWGWHDGGSVAVPAGEVTVALHDLTGFNGRCDCIVFTTESSPPPNDSQILAAWRRQALGLPEKPETKGPYDLVVVGGGYSGMGAAISAARMGLKVALIQDRPVLGGNGSSEVRVWAMGLIKRGKYPHIGEIVEEFADKAKKSPGTYEEFGDGKKEAVVRAEPNIDLFLNTHAFAVAREGARITSVSCFDTKTSREIVFTGRFFCDATGHATIGHLAGAETVMEPKGRMGMSNMWAWAEEATPQSFPETPWALPLTMADFPYPRNYHGPWYWESGYDKDPLGDAEGIRDWNLRAVFGAWNAMKNGDGAAEHTNAVLTWVAYVGGTRESRRILGDVVLTQDDIVAKKEFPDGCVPSTWSIDLHYPKKEYAKKFPDNPFISIAVLDERIDRKYGYPVPYRCFYSKDVENLFMAGRCISVTHEALGTVRVMKTCGMMGEVVGKAASVAAKHGTTPRGVYEKHWTELDELLKLPGQTRRATLDAPLDIPEKSATGAAAAEVPAPQPAPQPSPKPAPQTSWEQNAEPMPIAGNEAATKPGAPPAFHLPAGFAVERLFAVPKDQLGSWVCLATDPKGRLIASDQGGQGLVRITPAPLDGSKPTVVEKIPVAISAAQGLLWAFDALYVVWNDGPGSGLYRVTDSNGGATGPNLTQAAGRIVAETPDRITIVTDPENATKFVQVPRSDIEEILPSTESLMPKGQLDQLNESEVLDLVAYTLSRGNKNDARFRKQ